MVRRCASAGQAAERSDGAGPIAVRAATSELENLIWVNLLRLGWDET